LRDLQTHFATSPLFAPWLESQRRAMYLSGARPKHMANLKVKCGHGGTLDPMATGVLIVGVGKGTKGLQRFLECTKSYECTVLFGAATDSYDAVGKVVSRAPYAHVTRELVEAQLAKFRGKIAQKPSVFSALKVDGKKMYEYAREGGHVPDLAARPVEVLELELVEWLEPGSHEFTWPEQEVGGEEMKGAQKLLGIRKEDADVAARRNQKRARSPDTVPDHVEGAGEQPKRPRTDSEPAMSGALLPDAISPLPSQSPLAPSRDDDTDPPTQSQPEPQHPPPSPPAARLRMTVTSGFYVRSLCHDLGLACSSLGLMATLVRTRQGAYCLSPSTNPSTTTTSSQTSPIHPTNPLPVLEYTDLDAGPAVWEPKVKSMLEDFMRREGWEAEELEDEETWEASKERNPVRNFQGGGGGGGGGRGWKKGGKHGKGGRRD